MAIPKIATEQHPVNDSAASRETGILQELLDRQNERLLKWENASKEVERLQHAGARTETMDEEKKRFERLSTAKAHMQVCARDYREAQGDLRTVWNIHVKLCEEGR